MVNSGWLDFSHFKVFVEFFADEQWLNCGLEFWPEVCKMFLHYISRGQIFKQYDNLEGGCSRFGWYNVLLVWYFGIYELLDSQMSNWIISSGT